MESPAAEKRIPADVAASGGDEDRDTREGETIAMEGDATSTAPQGISASPELLVLERIMSAQDHATAFDRSRVQDILTARGDEAISAGDILEICDILSIPAGLLLDKFDGDAREVLRGTAA